MKKIVLEKNEISEETKVSMKVRIITAIAMGLIAIPLIVIGGWYFFFLVALVAVAAGYEIVHISKIKKSIKAFICPITIVAILLMTYYVFVYNNFFTDAEKNLTFSSFCWENFGSITFSTMILMLIAATYFLISFSYKNFTVNDVFYLLCMVILISLGLQSMMFLRYTPFNAFKETMDIEADSFKYGHSLFLFVYVLVGVMFNDIGAYFFGVLFGKHKMNPRISPKKTWEGFFGGVLISTICSFVFAFVMAATGNELLPALAFDNWYWILIISLLMPILGGVGDFVFSAIKRHFDVKDYSNLFPGHGGVLDRFDSLLFASSLVSGMLVFIEFIK